MEPRSFEINGIWVTLDSETAHRVHRAYTNAIYEAHKNDPEFAAVRELLEELEEEGA